MTRPVRLVWRVADMQLPAWPGLRLDACSRCRAPVYVDTGQPVPAAFRPGAAALVCVPCGLADDELRPEIERIHRAVRAASSMVRATDS